MRKEPDILCRLQGIYKHYPILGGVLKRETGRVNVLNGIDFNIERGGIIGLVGESGCGKSTLAKLLIKLEEPSAGHIDFDGHSLNSFKGKEKKQFYQQVQMVFQDPYSSLNPRMKIRDIVGEMIRIQGAGKKEELDRVSTILQEVELDSDVLDRFPHEFSGGQRQRIAIARALIVRPRLLIADEPVSALDLSLQAKTLALLERLKKAYDLTIFLISHDLRKVARFCDKVAVMYLGRIVEILPGNRLLKNARHPYTRALIDSMPSVDLSMRGKRKKVIKGEVPSPIDLPAGCAFHSRCEQRLPQCSSLIPQLKETDRANHHLACFLMDE